MLEQFNNLLVRDSVCLLEEGWFPGVQWVNFSSGMEVVGQVSLGSLSSNLKIPFHVMAYNPPNHTECEVLKKSCLGPPHDN